MSRYLDIYLCIVSVTVLIIFVPIDDTMINDKKDFVLFHCVYTLTGCNALEEEVRAEVGQ